MPKFTDKQCEVFQQRVDKILEENKATRCAWALSTDGEVFLDGWFKPEQVKAILAAIPQQLRVVWRVETPLGDFYTDDESVANEQRNKGALIIQYTED